MNFLRFDEYSDMDDKPLSPDKATKRYVTIWNGSSVIETWWQISEDGWELPEDDEPYLDNEALRMYEDGVGAPPRPKDEEQEEAKEDTHSHGKRDLEKGMHTNKQLDDTIDTKDTKHTVKPEIREKFDKFIEQQKKDTKPKKSEIEKNQKVEKSVIDSINEYVKKQPYGDKIKYVETQGSFAKGTDLAGSSDLDIFVSFDKSLSLEEIKKHSIDLGENVLKGMADKGSYKLMTGAESKKYGEANVDGVEVQIITISDVTLDDVKNGNMVSAQDRSPHHTDFMKKALKGKEDEVRTLKRFFKDAGVYDASQKKQGFSGFSTEVLIHNLGSFENVMKYFANFEKGSTLGDYKGTDKTPIKIADPIDPNRNLGSAFSQQEGTMSVTPNKNLARLIKTSQAMLEKGEMPKITKEKLPSISLDFNVPNNWGDPNKIAGQLQHVAGKLQKHLDKEGFRVKSPKDKITDDFEVDIPRITINHDEKTGKATIDFGFDNFDRESSYEVPFNPSKIPEDRRDASVKAYLEKNKDNDVEERDGKYYLTVEREGNVQDYMNHILKNEIDKLGLGEMTENIKKGHNLDKGDKEYENLTDRPKGSESWLSNFDFDDIQEGEIIDETKPRATEDYPENRNMYLNPEYDKLLDEGHIIQDNYYIDRCAHCAAKFKYGVGITDHLKEKHGIGESKAKECKTCNNFGDFVNIQLDCLKLKAKEGQSYSLLYDQPKVEGRKIKGTLAYAGVSLNNRLYLPEELAKGDGMTVPLILNHASTAGAEEEMGRLPEKFRSGLQQGLEMKVGEVTLNWQPDDLTLYYEGTVDDEFFIKEIDDAEMAVSLGLYYDSDSPQICDTDCYTVLKGAEFHEVSLVYHAGFPVATIEAVESSVKHNAKKALEFSRTEDPLVEKKDLKEINWSD